MSVQIGLFREGDTLVRRVGDRPNLNHLLHDYKEPCCFGLASGSGQGPASGEAGGEPSLSRLGLIALLDPAGCLRLVTTGRLQPGFDNFSPLIIISLSLLFSLFKLLLL